MRWRLRIVLLEWPARPIASWLHAEEDDAPPIGEKRARLPARLTRHFKVQISQPAAVGVYQRCPALGSEEEASRGGGFAARDVRMATRHCRHSGGQRRKCDKLSPVQVNNYFVRI